MRKLRFLLGAGFFTLTLLLVACSDDEGDDARTGSCEALDGQVPSVECESCMQTYCGDEYSSFCASGCTTAATSVSCQQRVGGVVACVLSGCADACASLTGSGGADGGITAHLNFSCYFADQGLCSAAYVTASTRESYERACEDTGGVLDDNCPTGGLIGCCGYTGGTRTCVYETAAPALDRDTCRESGGSWVEPE